MSNHRTRPALDPDRPLQLRETIYPLGSSQAKALMRPAGEKVCNMAHGSRTGLLYKSVQREIRPAWVLALGMSRGCRYSGIYWCSWRAAQKRHTTSGRV